MIFYDLARALRVEELVTRSQSLEADYRAVRTEKESLHNALRSQRAWFARSEVVKFARVEKTIAVPKKPVVFWEVKTKMQKKITEDTNLSEHRWRSAQATILDLIPAGPKLREAKQITWPIS